MSGQTADRSLTPLDLLRLLGETLQASRVGYALADLDAETLRLETVWEACPTASPPGLAFEDFALCRNAVASRDALSQLLLASGSTGCIEIPVVQQGKAIGFLFIHAEQDRAWTGEQLALADFTAAQLRGANSWARIEALRLDAEAQAVAATRHMPALLAETESPGPALETDVSARKRERDLIWKTSSDLFAIANTHYVPIDLNPAWTHMLGWTERDMRSRHPIEICHVDDRALSIAALDRLVKDGDRISVENRLLRKDGGVVWLQWDISRFDDKIYATGRNITALRELIKAQNDLAHASRIATLGEMAASIAHEVNQPLSAICTNGIGARRWLNRQEPDLGEVSQALERMVSEANRASEIISRIRSLALRGEPDRAPCDIATLVADCAELVRGQLRTLGASIEIAHAGDLGQLVADRVQLQQVIIVLVLNAAQAMAHAGSPERQVTLSVAGQARSIAFTVADTGPGIDPALACSVFDAFFTTKTDGMGMGLSIARSIVEAHGGTLALDATCAGGASFSFTVPRHPILAGD
ncbi:ATP-binding protein [Novosphingobium terrae]|uniref:ATP-binding protein n=1 Tax=Novosphingobium terrae TaxID=2726189 RepID=UPI001980F916|nr:ATP-binding protein [Novosphingobium terrae]